MKRQAVAALGGILLLTVLACRPPASSSAGDAASPASSVPPAEPKESTPGTIAEAANRLGWELLARRPEPSSALLPPFSVARLLLRSLGAGGLDAGEAWRLRVFGPRPAAELTLGFENLQASFTRHAATASIPLRLDGGAEAEGQSRRIEVTSAPVWQQRFERDRTSPGVFHGRGGPESEVPFMFQSARLPHAEVEGVTVLELPLREGRLSLLLWMPTSELPVARLIERLAESGGALGTSSLQLRSVELRLPKLVLREEASLGPALEGHWAGSGAAREGAWELAQRVSLELREEGSDGASGSSAVVGVRNPGPPPLRITVDRPFAFALRDRPSQAMLLIGRVESAQP